MKRKLTGEVVGERNEKLVSLQLRCEDGQPEANLVINMNCPCIREKGRITIQRLEDSLSLTYNLSDNGSGTKIRQAIQNFVAKRREFPRKTVQIMKAITPESVVHAFDQLHSQALLIFLG